MKKTIVFNFLLSYVLLAPLVAFGLQKGDNWENRPLIKRSKTTQSAVHGDSDAKKNAVSKKIIAWCKKPTVRYAVGALCSGALGLYALTRVMQVDVLEAIVESSAKDSEKEEESSDIVLDTIGSDDSQGNQEPLIEEINPEMQNTSVNVENQEEPFAIGKALAVATIGSGIGLIIGKALSIYFPWH